jgi:hypothetical protein
MKIRVKNRGFSAKSVGGFLVAHLALFHNTHICTSDSGRRSLPMTLNEQTSAGIFKQSIGARNRVGIGLSYWPARLHRLAKLIPWNRFFGSLKVTKIRALAYFVAKHEHANM